MFGYVLRSQNGKEQFFSDAVSISKTTSIAISTVIRMGSKGIVVNGFQVFRYFPTGSNVIQMGNVYQLSKSP